MPPLTNIIIQCRFSSTRLPGKAMYPLCGTPLLVFLIRRMRQNLSSGHYRVILATTKKREDDPVAVWAEQEGIPVVRGSQDDVLFRYLSAQAEYPSEAIVRVTADNPLTCPQALHDAVELHRRKKLDYVITRDFPYGSGVDVFSQRLLQIIAAKTDEPDDREHINDYVLKNPDSFKTDYLQAEGGLARPNLRVTVDTLEDYKRILKIFKKNNRPDPWNMPLKEAIKLMDENRTTP